MLLSAVMEDYLKTIYQLQAETGERVKTSAIAEWQDVTAPTVSSMLEKLDERGLVDRKKYGGVKLTPEGEQVALEVIRHHRLLEAYLAEQLNYPWSEVHDEACALEHHISEEFEERMVEVLGDPSTDPHGDPIPSASLERPADPDTDPILTFEADDVVVVRRVDDRDLEVLEYLAERGVSPGTRLIIEEVAPFGMISVTTDFGEKVSLPERVAKGVHVTSISPDIQAASSQSDTANQSFKS